MVRLVFVLVSAGALVAAALVGVAYSTGRLVHDGAAATEVRLPNLVTDAQVPSVIYAANGSVMATLRSALNRQPVPLDQVSPVLIQAVLDTEDHSFWLHGGMDVESVVRAMLADVNAGSVVQGGSTIAEQLVKGLYLTDQKTISRKIREAILAERLEDKYTKGPNPGRLFELRLPGQRCLWRGGGGQGVLQRGRRPCRGGPGRSAGGVDPGPQRLRPHHQPVGGRERRSEVLSRMLFYKSITPAQAAAANETPLPTVVHDAPGVSYTTYGYYVDQVVNELLDNPALGATADERVSALFTGGLKIYTNEVPSLQSYAQKVAVADIPSEPAPRRGGLCRHRPRTGNVEALVGGPHPRTDQFDDAVQGQRQPGSGFKLFTLIAALESGYNVYDSILASSPCAVLFPGRPAGQRLQPEPT